MRYEDRVIFQLEHCLLYTSDAADDGEAPSPRDGATLSVVGSVRCV
ncbi:hypothetical protein [Staphylococcus aureus]|nr:hypothetical protein [Staphylococcus aureus]